MAKPTYRFFGKILISIFFIASLHQLTFAEGGGFSGEETCESYADWILDTDCTEEYIKSVHGTEATCKENENDDSTPYYCYCVGFSESVYDLYNCDEFLNKEEEFVSFTNFEGELDSLEKDDYDPMLTESDNARDYISKVINFFLTFLGFVAVIGIMYSGSMYLLAGDDSSKAEKGKEGIKFISIGLLIIVGSYAIVNTVLESTTGEEGSLADNSGTSGVESVDGSSEFNNDTKQEVVDDVNTIEDNTNNVYASSYKVLTPLTQAIEELNLTDNEDIEEAISILSTIKKTVDQYSETYAAADSLQDVLQGYLDEQSDDKPCSNTDDSDCDGMPNEYEDANTCLDSNLDDADENPDNDTWTNIREYELGDSFNPCEANGCGGLDTDGDGMDECFENEYLCLDPDKDDADEDFDNDGRTNIEEYNDGTNPCSNDIAYFLHQLIPIALAVSDSDYDDYINALYDAISADYLTNIDIIINEYISLEDTFANLSADNDTKELYYKIYDATVTSGNGYLYDLKTAPNDDNFVLASDALNTLSSYVASMEFVDVTLNASTVKCQVPCTISFDSLGTTDPSDKTVENSQHKWDLNGDGNYNQLDVFNENPDNPGESTCNELGADTNGDGVNDPSSNVVCTYYESETYIVSLLVESNETDKYAPGYAKLKVVVEPPDTKVYLQTYPKSAMADKEVIYDFLSDTAVRNTVVEYAPDEAVSGIYFETTGSIGKSGRSLTDMSFDIEGEEYVIDVEENTDSSMSILYYFPTDELGAVKLGSYDVTLITREGDIVDEYPFTVVIEDPNIDLAVDEGEEVGDVWHFDASGSLASSPIMEYIWTYLPEGAAVATTLASTTNQADFKPDIPGNYSLTLEIQTEDGTKDTKMVAVTVDPVLPVSCFTYEIENEFYPATVLFDATCTINENSTDIYYYNWIMPSDFDYVFTDKNTEFDQGLETSSNMDGIYTNNPKMELRFQELGAFEISLNVSVDPNTGKSDLVTISDTQTKTISIDNLMDLDAQIYTRSSADSFELNNVQKVDNSSIDNHSARFFIDLSSIYIKENSYIEDYLNIDINCNGGELVFASDETGSVDWSSSLDQQLDSPILDYYCQYNNSGEYIIQITVEDNKKNTNTIMRRVYLVSEDQPLAYIEIIKDQNILNPDINDFVYGDITGSFKFDASKSINRDFEEKDSLEYSWYFQVCNSSECKDLISSIIVGESTTYVFDEVNRENEWYKVTLKILDTVYQDDPQEDTEEINILIEEQMPTINNFEISSVEGPNYENGKAVAPLEVTLFANVDDIDGRVIEYTWAYLNEAKLADGYVEDDPHITTDPETKFTINNLGNEGDSNEYRFVLIIEDNDGNRVGTEYAVMGNTVSCETSTGDLAKDCEPNKEPILTVVNGPNDNPIAGFNVDRTNIYVGESINFDAGTSYDPDGLIAEYIWDFQGNGLYDDKGIEISNTSYTFTQVANEGVEITLRVKDDMGATDTSDPLIVYVDAFTDPPVAAFNYEADGPDLTFTNNSSVDPDGTENAGSSELDPLTIVECTWDFDIDTDTNGDGIKDNDAQEFLAESADSGEIDSDGDGVVDSEDNCPDTANSDQSDADTDGTGDACDEIILPSLDLNSVLQKNIFAELWDVLFASNLVQAEESSAIPASCVGGVYRYAKEGSYRVKLSVKDSVGSTNTVTNIVEVKFDEIKASMFPASGELYEIDDSGAYVVNASDPNLTFQLSASGGVSPFTYILDGNIAIDSSGDGIKDNDDDGADLSFDPALGTKFEIKLIVTDDVGQIYEIKKTVKIEAAELTGYLTAYDTTSNKIELKGDAAYHLDVSDPNITFNIQALGGSAPYTYLLDTDTKVDSNGDGIKDNDNNGKNDDFCDIASSGDSDDDPIDPTDPIDINAALWKIFGLVIAEAEDSGCQEATTTESIEFDPNLKTEYNIKLKITDSLGEETVVTTAVIIDTGELKGYLTGYESTPVSNSNKLSQAPDGYYHQEITNPTIVFLIESSGGIEPYNYNLDANTAIDTDGDGIKDNDNDGELNVLALDTNTNTYTSVETINFDPAFANDFNVKLTIIDALGSESIAKQKVVLDSGQLNSYLIAYSDGTDGKYGAKLQLDLEDNAYHISATDDTLWFEILADGGAPNYNYSLDANIDVDSNGDGSKDNDADQKGVITVDAGGLSTSQFVSMSVDAAYASDFKAKLTIIDDLGTESSVIQRVIVDSEELTAYISSDPIPEPIDNKIHLSGTSSQVKFTVTSSGGVGLIRKCFDFNTFYDDNIDGDTKNDCASADSNTGSQYTLTYQSSWGNLQAMYTVTDELGMEDESSVYIVFNQQPVVVEPIDVFLLPSDSYSSLLYQSDGRIHFTKSPGKISFKIKATGGKAPYAFCIDKNINFDSDGNKVKNDDCNYTYTSATSDYITTADMDFYEEWGTIVVQVTATDGMGAEDTSKLQIVFDIEPDVTTGATNILSVLQFNIWFLVAGISGFVIIVLVVKKYKNKNI